MAEQIVPAQIERWGMGELALEGPRSGNPFLDVQLSVEFRFKNRVLEADGAELLSVSAPHESARGFRRYATVADACQMRLAQWHTTAPAVLVLYRQRVDPVARSRLDAAVQQRDADLVRQVAEQWPMSSAGDEARLGHGSPEPVPV